MDPVKIVLLLNYFVEVFYLSAASSIYNKNEPVSDEYMEALFLGNPVLRMYFAIQETSPNTNRVGDLDLYSPLCKSITVKKSVSEYVERQNKPVALESPNHKQFVESVECIYDYETRSHGSCEYSENLKIGFVAKCQQQCIQKHYYYTTSNTSDTVNISSCCKCVTVHEKNSIIGNKGETCEI